MKESNYWFNDLNELTEYNKLDRFIPKNDMTYIDKTNSIVRLSIYVGIILSILTRNYLYLYVPLGMMLFSYVMYLLRKVDDESSDKIKDALKKSNTTVSDVEQDHLKPPEQFGNYLKTDDGLNYDEIRRDKQRNQNNFLNKKCVESTNNNPFMNPSPMAPRDIGASCSPLNEDTKRVIENNFNKGLFKDANDIFNKRNGFRQFYTVPGNTFPNNRDTFMKWCYSRPKTCKEGNGNQCVANNEYNLRNTHTGSSI